MVSFPQLVSDWLMCREWERDKARILSAVAAGGGGAGADMTELSLARDLSTSFVSRTRLVG